MKKITILLLALIIIIAIGYLVTKQVSKKSTEQKDAPKHEIGQKEFLPQGQIAESLPKYLVLENTTTLQSYTIPYEGMTQSTAQLQSPDSIKTVFDAYKKLLTEQYTIKDQKYTATGANIYAYKKTSRQEVSITILTNPSTKKTEIVISYLDKETK